MFPLILIVAGSVALLAVVLGGSDRPVPIHEPDLPSAPTGKTRWKKVNEILPELQAASASSGIPMGLLVGWIAKESGGLLEEYGSPRGKLTKYNERGYFQLMPAESAAIGVDHDRLSYDPQYSINAGLKLIATYMGRADHLGIAPRGSSYYWRLVKLIHAMGSGAVAKIVAAAKAVGATNSWDSFEQFALDHNSELLHATKHAPAKWFPFVDEIAQVGAPFGFGTGSASTSVVGGYDDIPDPLAVIQKRRRG